MITAVILAAGASRRLGRPKQTLILDGEMLIERAMRIAQQAGLARVFVVVSAAASFGDVVRQHGGSIVLNHHAEEGMASSIRAGVAAAQAIHAEGVVVMACDQIGTRAGHLRLLYEDSQRVTGSRYAEKTGVPAYFPASSFDELLALTGDAGARAMLRGAHTVINERLNLDIDTEEDVTAMLRLHGERT